MDKVVGGLLEQSRPDVRRRYDNQGLSRSTSVDDSHQSGMLLFALCATVCTKPIFLCVPLVVIFFGTKVRRWVRCAVLCFADARPVM